MDTPIPQPENAQIQERREKLSAQRASQKIPFPNDFVPQQRAAEIFATLNAKTKEALASETNLYVIAGRIMLKRVMGKASFITIQDRSGRIQIYVRQDEIANYEDFKHFDLGDI